MGKHFSLDVSNISISHSNKEDFLFLNLHAISNGDNRNGSHFLEESLVSGIPTFYNKPILAYYNTKIDDTEEHNSKLSIGNNGELFYDYQYNTAEKPCGLIPESAVVSTEMLNDKMWIVVKNAVIWTEYNKQLIDLLGRQKEKKVSVEVEILESYIENDVEYIQKFKLLGITILGENIESGIADAKLIVGDLKETIRKYRIRFSKAYSNNNKILDKYDNIKKENIKVDKSKNKVSNDSWGDVSKSEIRDKVMDAKNYKSIVHDVYLLVEDGWESAPSEHLKYPVMQYKNGEFVYNSEGLLSAQIYGENHNKEIANKAKEIREKLDLIEKEERDSMEKYIESAKKQGYICIGHFSDKLRFVKETCENTEKMSVYEVDVDKEDFKEKFDESELENKLLHSADELENAKKENMAKFESAEEKIAKLEKEKAEIEKKADELEVKSDELEAKIDELEKDKAKEEEKYKEMACELETIKMAKFEEETDEDMDDEEDLDEDDKEELKKMRADKKFSNREEFVKEMSYRIMLKKKETKKNGRSKLDFSIDKKNDKKDKKNDSVFTSIENI